MGTDLLIRFIGLDLVSRAAERAGNSVDRLQNRVIRSGIASAQAWIASGIAAVTFGTSLLVAAAAMAAVGVHATEVAATFQSDMVMVVTHAGLARDQIQGISKDLLDMAPQVGFGPDALAKAFYHVQSVVATTLPALDSAAKKEEILRQAAELAAIGHADLTDTVNTVLGVLVNYKSTTIDAASAAAQLNAIVGSGNLTMQQFASAMSGGLLAVASQAGVSLASLGGAMGTLTDESYSSTRAATYLRSAIIQMTVPSGPAATALEAIGLSGDDVAKQMGYFNEVLSKAGVTQTEIGNELHKSGSLGDVLNNFLMPALEKAGLKGPEAAALIEKAFGGIRSGAGVIGLTNNLQGLMDKETRIKGATKDWADTWDYYRQHDPQFIIRQLGAQFQDLEVVIGGALIPVLRSLNNFLEPMLKNFMKFAEAHGDLVAKVTVAAIAITGLLGVLLMAGGALLIMAGTFGVLASIAGGAVAAIGLFVGGLTLGPVIAIILGIVVAVIILAELFKHMAPVTAAFSHGVKTLVDEMRRGMDFGHAFGFALKAMGLPLKAAMDIGNALSRVLKILSSAFQNITHAAGDLVKQFLKELDSSGQMKQALEQLGPLWSQLAPILTMVGQVIGILAAIIAGVGLGALKGLVEMLGVVIPAAILIVVGALQVVTGVINLFVDFFSGHWSRLGEDIKSITTGLVNVVEGLIIGVFGGILAFLHGFVTGAVGFFKWLYDELVGHSIIPDLINEIGDWFKQLPGKILGVLQDLVTTAATAASNIGDAIFKGITGALSGLGGALTSAITSAIPGGAGGPLGTALHSLGIPGFAEGGYVTRPTLAMVGENEPEFIIPKSKMAGVRRANLPSATQALTVQTLAPVKRGLVTMPSLVGAGESVPARLPGGRQQYPAGGDSPILKEVNALLSDIKQQHRQADRTQEALLSRIARNLDDIKADEGIGPAASHSMAAQRLG